MAEIQNFASKHIQQMVDRIVTRFQPEKIILSGSHAGGQATPDSDVDLLVSWNFKHIVNLGRIRLFNAVNLEQRYGLIEIRTPREVLYEEDV